MKQVVLNGPGVSLHGDAAPPVAGPGEVLLRVIASGSAVPTSMLFMAAGIHHLSPHPGTRTRAEVAEAPAIMIGVWGRRPMYGRTLSELREVPSLPRRDITTIARIYECWGCIRTAVCGSSWRCRWTMFTNLQA